MSYEPVIFVVDDEELVRNSIKWLLDPVGYQTREYSNAIDFLENYNDEAGCLILDLRMPKMSGMELQDVLLEKNINIPIVFVTGHGDVPTAVRAMRGNAVDFLTKPINNQALLESINKAIRKDASERLKQEKSAKTISLAETLTPRESEVMQLMVKGRLTKVIAHELGISPYTAEIHRGKVMKKMQVKSLAQLVGLAITYELVEFES